MTSSFLFDSAFKSNPLISKSITYFTHNLLEDYSIIIE